MDVFEATGSHKRSRRAKEATSFMFVDGYDDDDDENEASSLLWAYRGLIVMCENTDASNQKANYSTRVKSN